ncbi:MAG: hypothetical protein AAF211_31455, partial [Myxococcota bacterium]
MLWLCGSAWSAPPNLRLEPVNEANAEPAPEAGLADEPLTGDRLAALQERLPAPPPPAPEPRPRPTVPPPVDAEVLAPTPESRAAAGPLRVERVHPDGAARVDDAITVTFSQPMVALGDADRPPPITVTPAPVGRWRWAGQRTAILEGRGS